MEGPTPVSSLLHSATLVLSGIIVYCSNLCYSHVTLLSTTFAIGTCIIVIHSVIDSDIKKVAAITTCISISIL